MYKINQRVQFPIVRSDSHFDRACEAAIHYATGLFGVDECGHFQNVKDAHRSECGITVRFTDYHADVGYVGHQHTYMFEAWVSKG